MKQTTRWMLSVSSDVDRRVRRHLASTGRKGDLAAFVEEAVRQRLLQLSMKTVPAYSRPPANDIAPIDAAADPNQSNTSDRNYGS
jgi:hypothetical protein